MKFTIHPSLLLGLTLAVASPVLLTSCDPKDQQAVLLAQEEVEALKKAKSKLESEIKQLKEDTEKANAEQMKRTEELQKEADEAKAQFEKLQDEAAKARKELEDYMAKYKVGYRAKLKGLTLPTLQTTDDQTYQTVVFREITASEVAISHSAGAGRVPMEKLPADLQRKFLYDPAEVKQEAEAKVAAAAAVSGLDGLDGIEGIDAKIVQKDPNRSVNPIVVHNLRSRIVTRQQQIEKAKAEAARVKRAGDDRTNLGKYRLQVLNQRADRLREEIKSLVNMLDKELNG
jgi:hypothetical protein